MIKMRLPRLPEEYVYVGQPNNYRSYPEGSKERAKAFAIDLRIQYKDFASSLSSWNVTENVAFREKPWEILGDDEETFFKKVIGITRSEIREKATQAEQAKAAAQKAKPLNGHGGDRKTDQGNKNENVTLIEQRGNGLLYRISQLKRDHPTIAERLQSGEFKNVREAERAAGLDVPPKLSRVRKLIRAYDRLTESEQNEFREAIG